MMMEIKNVLASVSNNSLNSSKADSKTEKNNDTFSKLVSKFTGEEYTDKNCTDKKDTEMSNDSDKAEFIKAAKQELKKAGVKDEDIDKVKDMDSLKKLVEDKCVEDSKSVEEDDGTDKIDTDKLMAILASMMNLNPQDLEKARQALGNNIKGALEEVLKQSGGNKDKLSELMNSLKGQLKNILEEGTAQFGDSAVKAVLGKQASEDALKMIKNSLIPQNGEIKQNFKSVIQDSLKDVCKTSEGNKDSLVEFKSVPKESILNKTLASSGEDKSKSFSQDKDSKDNSFLKSLTGETKTDNNFKATAFGAANFNNTVNNVQEAETVTINKATVSSDVIKALKYMETNNMKNLTIKITPHDLGEVIIKVTMQSGVMKASITATNKEAYNLLNSQMQDMTDKLQNNEIKIQNVSLNVYNEDTTFFKDGTKENRENQKGKGKKVEGVEGTDETLDIEELLNESKIESNVDMLA